MDDTDLSARLDRAERLIASRTNSRPKAPVITELEQGLAEDLDNRKDVNGHSPKMLRDWEKMQQAQIDSGAAKDVAEADAQLDAYFTDIKEGRRDENGDLFTPAAP